MHALRFSHVLKGFCGENKFVSNISLSWSGIFHNTYTSLWPLTTKSVTLTLTVKRHMPARALFMTWDANESETEKTDTLNFDKFKFNYEVQKSSSEIKIKKMEKWVNWYWAWKLLSNRNVKSSERLCGHKRIGIFVKRNIWSTIKGRCSRKTTLWCESCQI